MCFIGNLSRVDIGQSATFVWKLQKDDPDVALICIDNSSSTLFHVRSFIVAIKDPKVTARTHEKTNELEFTILNVTMEDAGTYRCQKYGHKDIIGVLFVWGKVLDDFYRNDRRSALV